MEMDITVVNEQVEKESLVLRQIMTEIGKAVVGQNKVVERLLIALLCDGHVLLEGLPGLAKTTVVKALALAVNTSFQRIQFTPDLLPADIIGTQIYMPDKATFEIRKGPIFHNIILADEINRAPAKVQSALLEAMQERQVTIGDETFRLDTPFLVMATQNPIEQEGTYPLPEAQVDRFMMKVLVGYPDEEEEKAIVKLCANDKDPDIRCVATPDSLSRAKEIMRNIHMEDKILEYIIRICRATREPSKYGVDYDAMINIGVSPRGAIWLSEAAKAHAFLKGRGYVTPQDVKSVAPDVLRHRIIPSYEAEASGITSDDILNVVLERIEVP
jgi:MoxR-like ATPase